MSAADLSAVFVTWNAGDAVVASVDALRRSAKAAGASLEVVVVDNASEAESRRLVAEARPDVLVENSLNAGYVVAASQGVARARGPWAMLVNPDLTVSEGFIGAMLEVARTCGPEVACLVPDVRYASDPSVVNSRGIVVDAIGIPAEHHAGRKADDANGTVEVFGPSTSCCLVRRTALAEVGGLEPLYFAYLEDVDLGWRLRKRGLRTIVVLDAVAWHEGSASIGEGSWLKSYLVARNRRALFRLHGPSDIRSRAKRTIAEAGHATVVGLTGGRSAPVRGRAAALRTHRYTAFLRASNRVIGIADDARVPLVRRQTLRQALRRKRTAASLMHGAKRT